MMGLNSFIIEPMREEKGNLQSTDAHITNVVLMFNLLMLKRGIFYL